MFEKMGEAGLPCGVVSPPRFQVDGDLRAVEVRHLHGNQAQAVGHGFVMAGNHQSSVTMDSLFHQSKVTEKGMVVKGFGRKCGDRT
jgi:hypothetical protein